MLKRLKAIINAISDLKTGIEFIVFIAGSGGLLYICRRYLDKSIQLPLWLILIFSISFLWFMIRGFIFLQKKRLHDPYTQYKKDIINDVLCDICLREGIEITPRCPICGAKLTIGYYTKTPIGDIPFYYCTQGIHWQSNDLYKLEFDEDGPEPWPDMDFENTIKTQVDARISNGDWKNAKKRIEKLFNSEFIKSRRKKYQNEIS